jgi:hypothetical protein
MAARCLFILLLVGAVSAASAQTPTPTPYGRVATTGGPSSVEGQLVEDEVELEPVVCIP